MGHEHTVEESGAGEVVVLYIGGEGRSGSTLLSAMLGQYPGFLPVGELRGVWQAVVTNELCGCGTPFSECEFWTEVGNKAFGGWNSVDVQRMLHLDAEYARHRFVARLAIPTLRRRHSRELSDFTAILNSLYTAVRDVSGCDVIVDSTKDPPYAFLLREVPGLALRVVHLVRDSRGVAYSWEKSVARPEYANHPTLQGTSMDRRRPWRSALEWDAKNALFHYLGHSGVPRLLLRYESLLNDPDISLQQVLALGRTGAQSLARTQTESRSPDEYESLPHHTLGGNRIRFERGVVRLRADDEWRREMKRSHRVLVTVPSLPFLLAYGYLGRPKSG